MSTAPTKAKIFAAVAVEYHWIVPPGGGPLVLLSINGVPYACKKYAGGVRMINAHSGKPYDLAGPSYDPACDCPDAVYRPGRELGCKHRRALLERLPGTEWEDKRS